PLTTQFSDYATEQLQQIISGALRKDREQRYQAIEDLLADLRGLKDNLDLQSKPGLAGKNAGSSAQFISSSIARHKTWAGAAAALLLTVTIGVGYLSYKSVVSRRTSSPKNIELRLMTVTGNSSETAISPDGRYIASFNSGGILIREIATTN